MCAIELLTIEDLEGRRICERLGKRPARSRNRPFNVSRRALSTALWVALRSAVFARLLGLRFWGWAAAPPLALLADAPTPVSVLSMGGGRASV